MENQRPSYLVIEYKNPKEKVREEPRTLTPLLQIDNKTRPKPGGLFQALLFKMYLPNSAKSTVSSPVGVQSRLLYKD